MKRLDRCYEVKRKNFNVTPEQEQMLWDLANHYNLTESDMLRQLIKWEWDLIHVWDRTKVL